MIKNKILIQLKGGIGNQMFQYAFAKSLALKFNSQLYIDNYSGFIFDFKYKRNYELKYFNLNDKRASVFHLILFYLSKFDPYLRYRDKSKYFLKRPYASFLFELDQNFNDQYLNINFKGLLFINGYWQSPMYFNQYDLEIKNNFKFRYPFKEHIIALSKKMQNEHSIALCLRLYEEEINPGLLSSTGKQKTVNELKNQINKLLANKFNCCVYFFCTHKPDFINHLDLPPNTIFITGDSDYNNTIETLYLLKSCKYYMIMNSTYYWWGAYLSEASLHDNTVFADSNFLNKDIFPTNWAKF